MGMEALDSVKNISKKSADGINMVQRDDSIQDFRDLGRIAILKRNFGVAEASPPSFHVDKSALEDSDWESDEPEKKRRKVAFGGIAISDCGRTDRYDILNTSTYRRGSYSNVYKARDKLTGEIVAIKDLYVRFVRHIHREIEILKRLKGHPSIVEFRQVVVDKDAHKVCIVMEYIENDLRNYMSGMRKPFSLSQVKSLMKQLLEGVKFIHQNRVMHRDLKLSNLLISNDGMLKICDFGLSLQVGSGRYTPNKGTRCYNAPEVLLGTRSYSTAVDMWSVGCIMAALFLKKPIFKGHSEIALIDGMLKILGTPADAILPGLSCTPGTKMFVNQPLSLLGSQFTNASPEMTGLGLDLLSKFLTFDPNKRITAQDALNHDWFTEAPLPNEKPAMD